MNNENMKIYKNLTLPIELNLIFESYRAIFGSHDDLQIKTSRSKLVFTTSLGVSRYTVRARPPNNILHRTTPIHHEQISQE